MYLFLFERNERDRRKKQILHPSSTGLLSKWLHQLGLDRSDVSSLALPPDLPHGCRCQSTWAILCCPPTSTRRGLDWKWSSWDSNWHSHGTPASQMVALHSVSAPSKCLFHKASWISPRQWLFLTHHCMFRISHRTSLKYILNVKLN